MERRHALRVVTAGLALSFGAAACGGNSKSCHPFVVYSQNRWSPPGGAIRAYPSKDSPLIDPADINASKVDPNQKIDVNGWVNTGVEVYPQNPPPFNNGIWFRLADRIGWVNFAAVRGETTQPDSTGASPDGGKPAPTPPSCELPYKPQ